MSEPIEYAVEYGDARSLHLRLAHPSGVTITVEFPDTEPESVGSVADFIEDLPEILGAVLRQIQTTDPDSPRRRTADRVPDQGTIW